MKTKTIAAFIFGLCFTSISHAHGLGGEFGRLGGFGTFDLWGHHGDLGSLGFGFGDYGLGFGFGFGLFDAERTQIYVENRLDKLMTQYDDGVAGGTDFFSSTEYDRIVNKTERLNDGYGLFVSGVERSVDRLTDFITIANDDLTFYNDLLADYQANTSLPPERLARIETRINHITDRLDSKIDFLTDKQTTLQTNLPTYQSCPTDLSTCLSDITAAGSGTPASITSSLLPLTSALDTSLLVAESSGAESASLSSPLETASVPEPASATLFLLASGALSVWGARRRRD